MAPSNCHVPGSDEQEFVPNEQVEDDRRNSRRDVEEHSVRPSHGSSAMNDRAVSTEQVGMPIEKSRDPKEFAAFELSGWNARIRGYDAAFGVVARQTVAPMLDAAGRHASARCLLWPGDAVRRHSAARRETGGHRFLGSGSRICAHAGS